MRLLLIALLLLPTFSAAADQWTEVKSPHFTVITDAGEKRGREVAKRFEQMRQVFGTLVLHKEVSTSRPVQILAVKNTKGLRMVLPTFKGKTVAPTAASRAGNLGTEGEITSLAFIGSRCESSAALKAGPHPERKRRRRGG